MEEKMAEKKIRKIGGRDGECVWGEAGWGKRGGRLVRERGRVGEWSGEEAGGLGEG